MIEYVAVCTTFGLLMLIVSWRAAALSNRVRLSCCIVAMGCWLVPWSVFYQASPVWAAVIYVDQPVNPIPSLPVFDQNVVNPLPGLPHPFWWAVAVGLMIFTVRLIRYAVYVYRLAQSATDHDNVGLIEHGVRIRHSPLVTSPQLVGFFSPVVWLRETDDVAHADQAIRHELVHKDRHDNWILLLTTFLRDVIWWNPVMHLLHRRCRELIELSCDEVCQQRDERYREALAAAVLEGTHTHHSLVASAFGSRKFMMERIKALEEVNVDRKKLGLLMGIVMVSVTVFLSPAIIHADSGLVELSVVTTVAVDDEYVLEFRFRGEDIYDRLIQNAADLGLAKEVNFGENGNRQLSIQSKSKSITNQVLSAFDGTEMEGWYNYPLEEFPTDYLADEPLLVDVSVHVRPGGKIFEGTLVGNSGDWTGVNTSKYLVRLRPTLQLRESGDVVAVHIHVEISEHLDEGYRVISRPRIINRLGEEAWVRQSSEDDGARISVSVKANRLPS
ncbi:MAG: M56 family metallopeptidase [Pseudomonadota bacterium]